METEIVKKGGALVQNEIMVSIICNAYNHQKYIKDALEGFVMQKTNFPFEVLIHDDASTDKTADIIREYEKKYPELIKPIYQTENQYSQGVKISESFQFPRVKGKYVAVCEGDDYWTDPCKLQKQYDAMEQHPEVDICAHQANVLDAQAEKVLRKFTSYYENKVFSTEEVIMGGGGFVATNSLFYRSEIDKDRPPFRQKSNMDFVLQTHGSLRGGMLYLKDCMAMYRTNVNGSWTTRNKRDKDFRVKNFRFIDSIWEQVDKDTDYKYKDIIHAKRMKNSIAVCHDIMTLKELKSKPYLEYYKKLPLKKRVKIIIKYLAPGIVKVKRKLFN